MVTKTRIKTYSWTPKCRGSCIKIGIEIHLDDDIEVEKNASGGGGGKKERFEATAVINVEISARDPVIIDTTSHRSGSRSVQLELLSDKIIKVSRPTKFLFLGNQVSL